MRVAEGEGEGIMGGLNSSLNINQRKQEQRKQEEDGRLSVVEDDVRGRKEDRDEEIRRQNERERERERQRRTRQLVRQS